MHMLLSRLLLVCALAPLALWADIIHLKNGKSLQGEIVTENDDVVVLKVPNGQIKIKQRDIELIERQTPLEYLMQMGRQHLQQRNVERAVSTLEEGYKTYGHSAELRRMLAGAYDVQGQHYLSLHRFADAREAFDKLSRLDPAAELVAHRARQALEKLEQHSRSLDELLQKARRLVQGRQWAQAIAAYEDAINYTGDARQVVAPALAQCYVGRAKENAASGQSMNAAADLEAALRLDPALADNVEKFYVSCALPAVLNSLELGDAAAAQVDLKRVLSFAPTNASVLYVSGRLHEALGQVPAAAADYAYALGDRVSNPTREFTATLRKRLEEKLNIAGRKWRLEIEVEETRTYSESADAKAHTIETENFTIFAFNEALARQVAEAAEYHRTRILNELQLSESWKGKAKIFLHRTQAEYTSKTGQPEWTGGFAKVMLQHGRLHDPQVHSWQSSPRLLKSVLPHEITHLVINYNVPELQALPKCLNEGFAVLMEPQFRHEYFMHALRIRLKSQSFIALPELLAAQEYPKDPEFLYAEGFGLLQYLLTFKDLKTVAGLLKHAKGPGQVQSELLRMAGVRTLDELESVWKAWLLSLSEKK